MLTVKNHKPSSQVGFECPYKSHLRCPSSMRMERVYHSIATNFQLKDYVLNLLIQAMLFWWHHVIRLINQWYQWKMVMLMKELGVMVELMAMVDTFLPIDLKLLLFGLITKLMVRVHFYILAGTYLLVAGKITKPAVMACINMQTAPNMTDNGKKIYLMVTDEKPTLTKVSTWGTFLEERSMAKEH